MTKNTVAALVLLFVAAAATAQTTNFVVVPAFTNAAVGVDWRYGRPGVFVVTNAEPAVTNFLAQRTVTVNGVSGSPVSNLVFDVIGGSGGGIAASEVTNVAQWAAAQATQSLVTAAAAAATSTNAGIWAATQATQSLSRVIAVENGGWWSLYLVTP